MEDNKRIIDAARRQARRIAKKTPDLTYQQALDQVARELGRKHWSDYAANPVEVPRDQAPNSDENFIVNDTKPDLVALMGLSQVDGTLAVDWKEPNHQRHQPEMLSGIDWNLPAEEREKNFNGLPFVPAWNALDEKFVGSQVPEGKREKHVSRIADILIPRARHNSKLDYLENTGRKALEGFLMAEITKARIEKRTASIPNLIDWINAGLRASVNSRGPKDDSVGNWIQKLANDSNMGAYVRDRMLPLIAMRPERLGIMGTMDKAFLVFTSRATRALTS